MKKLLFTLIAISSFAALADFTPYQVNVHFTDNKTTYQQNPWALILSLKLKIQNDTKKIILGQICTRGGTGYYQHSGGGSFWGTTNDLREHCSELDSEQIFNIITKVNKDKFQVVNLQLTEQNRTYLLSKFADLAKTQIPWGEGEYFHMKDNPYMTSVNTLVQLVAKTDQEFLSSFQFTKKGNLDLEGRGLQGTAWEGVTQHTTKDVYTFFGSAPVIKIK